MELRPYQKAAITAIEDEWRKVDRTLIVLATGTGKTIIFSHFAADCVRNGEKVLILAHRGELLDQAADKLRKATGLKCAIEKGDETCHASWYRVVVGSVQSLMRPDRLARFDKNYFDVVIIDECHHVISPSYQSILSHFEGAKVLGVTATPDRGDMRSLGEYFQSLAFEYGLPSAVKDGYLCPIKAKCIPLNIDLSAVKCTAGDFAARDLGTALDPYLFQIADEMAKECRGRKTVVFLPLIATSQKFADILTERGFRCAEVNGESPDRADILRDFAAGRYDVLCNSMLLTEGWDEPSADCIVCLRPTRIRSLYAQIIGRGTRLHPGKTDLLILDFLWHCERHSLARPAHLIAESEEVADKMIEILNESGEEMELGELETQAEGDCVADREAALADKLKELRAKQRKLVDPLQYEMSILAEDLTTYVPTFGAEALPPTPDQLAALESLGIFPDAVECAGKAEKLIERLEQRRAAGLASARQIKQLELRGFRNVGNWEFSAARKMIDRIAGNKWQVPRDIDAATYVPKKQIIDWSQIR